MKTMFQSIIDNTPTGFIMRKDIKEKTGGLLHPRTMANLDCLGEGIPEKFRIGNQICYPINAVVEFLESRVVRARR